jgi:hypothetical protein
VKCFVHDHGLIVNDRTLEFHVGSDLLDDDSTNPTSLGIPSHVVTDLECFRHSGHPDPQVQPND